MIEETAKVVAIDGDLVTVEAAVKSTCSGCKAKEDCGTGAIARAFSHKFQTLHLRSPFPVKLGQNVTIGIHEKSILVASWWLYLVPLLVFVMFNILLFSQLSSFHELTVCLLALLPTLASFFWVSKKIKSLDKVYIQVE